MVDGSKQCHKVMNQKVEGTERVDNENEMAPLQIPIQVVQYINRLQTEYQKQQMRIAVDTIRLPNNNVKKNGQENQSQLNIIGLKKINLNSLNIKQINCQQKFIEFQQKLNQIKQKKKEQQTQQQQPISQSQVFQPNPPPIIKDQRLEKLKQYIIKFVNDTNTALDIQLLQKHEIKAVLSVAKQLPVSYQTTNQFSISNNSCLFLNNYKYSRIGQQQSKSQSKLKQDQLGIEHLVIPINDCFTSNIQDHFEKVNEFINVHVNAGINVLVHCALGVSRSSTCVLAYLIKRKQMKLKQAYQFLKSRRKVVQPNEGFIDQLIEYQEQMDSIRRNEFSNKNM